MRIRGIVDRLEGDQVVILMGEEGHPIELPQVFLPGMQESDMLCFDINMELPASEVKKINPKSLLERLAWRP